MGVFVAHRIMYSWRFVYIMACGWLTCTFKYMLMISKEVEAFLLSLDGLVNSLVNCMIDLVSGLFLF